MNILTPEQLVLLNQKVIAENGAATSQMNFDELKVITDITFRKNRELFYEYRTISQKAAKLGSLIATRKPFLKANKETAVLALLTFLDINGQKIENFNKDIEELYKYLEESNEKTSIDNTCNWIEAHTLKEDN